jgi:septal ring factor EnvC (AmiA/AmiB activator)
MSIVIGTLRWSLTRSEKSIDALIAGHGAEIAALKKELAEHKLHVAQSYVTQSELARSIEKLEKTVDKLLDAINQMARDSKEAFAELHRRVDLKEDK